jgi:rSAM/selenodomain-associated transferase 1
MLHAFEEGFKLGYRSICIIGTDCLELTPEIILQAFEQLASYNAVLGPAKDGGYYLLGMNQLVKEAFQNKEWSTDAVASSTLRNFENQKLKYSLLTTLSDVDEEQDLPADWQI